MGGDSTKVQFHPILGPTFYRVCFGRGMRIFQKSKIPFPLFLLKVSFRGDFTLLCSPTRHPLQVPTDCSF